MIAIAESATVGASSFSTRKTSRKPDSSRDKLLTSSATSRMKNARHAASSSSPTAFRDIAPRPISRKPTCSCHFAVSPRRATRPHQNPSLLACALPQVRRSSTNDHLRTQIDCIHNRLLLFFVSNIVCIFHYGKVKLKMARDVFILGGKRTPMGEYVGALKDISAIDLGAISARGALAATHVSADEIDHTIIGNALQTSGDAIYGARHVALKAGVPFDRPALTVNRLCGSGIQSIISGAQMIQLGEAQTALVGGMESMSQAPHVIRGARSGFALGQGKLEDSLMVALLDTYCNTPMAGTAENLARRYEISREEQDRYALRSQQEAKRALDAGIFAEEIVPVEIRTRKGTEFFDTDDHMRP